MDKTIVINLVGSPGTGKSTIAAELFSKLKWNKINCEYVSEFAKDLTWEERHTTLCNQVYIFGKQHHRLFRLKNKVDVIVTDCPLILSAFYEEKYGSNREKLKDLIFDESENGFYNMYVFLNRTKDYNPIGRNQTEHESNEIRNELKSFCDKYINYIELDANEKTTNFIINELNNIMTK